MSAWSASARAGSHPCTLTNGYVLPYPSQPVAHPFSVPIGGVGPVEESISVTILRRMVCDAAKYEEVLYAYMQYLTHLMQPQI